MEQIHSSNIFLSNHFGFTHAKVIFIHGITQKPLWWLVLCYFCDRSSTGHHRFYFVLPTQPNKPIHTQKPYPWRFPRHIHHVVPIGVLWNVPQGLPKASEPRPSLCQLKSRPRALHPTSMEVLQPSQYIPGAPEPLVPVPYPLPMDTKPSFRGLAPQVFHSLSLHKSKQPFL